jgi:general secretion pathway protein A
MYEQHWGLKRLPFRNVPEADFFFRGETHAGALLKLRYLIENRLSAGLLFGGTGTGKTCLVHMLRHELADIAGPFVHLVFPQLSVNELLAWLAIELGGEETPGLAGKESLDQSLRQIERLLTRRTETKRRCVIVVDEAHLIDDPRVLQSLCLLLNFGDRPEIELTLLLAGDWPLAARIERMGSFDDRIAVRSVLAPLSHDECAGYIEQRLKGAGARKQIFDGSAVQAIFETTGGIPRRINRICDLALLVGFADAKRSISARDIETVAAEFNVAPVAA